MPLEQVYAYHERTKHHLDRYAAGPPTLDWDNQPDPFRRFGGCEIIELPLLAETLETPWRDLFGNFPAPQAFKLNNIALLLELSLGLAAWKQYGDARWALRCNPSSGNLHPSEGYVICTGLADLADGVYHYAPEAHALERRCRFPASPLGKEQDAGAESAAVLYLGLSSVIWREAWKYGERAFRYVQLDCGHVLGAFSYAAALLGWRLTRVPLGDAQLATLLGLDRKSDFHDAEAESPDVLLTVTTNLAQQAQFVSGQAAFVAPLFASAAQGEWQGQANHLGGEPHFHWPVIDEVEAATLTETLFSPLEKKAGIAEKDEDNEAALENPPPLAFKEESTPQPLPTDCAVPAATLIRTRRSAQAFDGSTVLARPAFYRLLDAVLPRPEQTPWTLWPGAARIHLVVFLHRVEGLPPGLYALPRHAQAEAALTQALNPQFDWTTPEDCPASLPLRHLVSANAQKAARTVSCHQAIASHSCFSVAMLSEFDATLALHPAEYRRLYWEAGLIGQVLYLEAEAAGVRGTGIGCFFDDSVHQLLGIEGTTWQSLYHFTVGGSITDTRLQTLAPYAHLEARKAANM